MTLYKTDGEVRVIVKGGDAREHLAARSVSSIDAIVTDPPYELDFMGKSWDNTGIAFDPTFWAECQRVLKPGGHLLAFGGTRTFHRIAVAIEDGGFKIRDSIAWLYGSGFPKSHNLKDEWQGWGTALKPAFEPIIVARKPMGGTVAANVLAHGTGALNIDASRIAGAEGGRWPANVILDESQAAALDEQSGYQKDGVAVNRNRPVEGSTYKASSYMIGISRGEDVGYGGGGGASRFFYCAKASKKERPVVDGVAHATVKPLALMRYLVRLVTPPDGIVLDPFAGSGTTLEASLLEGFRSIGYELTPEHLPLIAARLAPYTD